MGGSLKKEGGGEGVRYNFFLLKGRGALIREGGRLNRGFTVQSNLFNTDSKGTERSVRVREVSV